MTTFPSDPNIMSTPHMRPTIIRVMLYPYSPTNTILIFKINPARIIDPTSEASTCTLGSHWCRPYTGNFENPISDVSKVIIERSKFEINANLNVSENQPI